MVIHTPFSSANQATVFVSPDDQEWESFTGHKQLSIKRRSPRVMLYASILANLWFVGLLLLQSYKSSEVKSESPIDALTPDNSATEFAGLRRNILKQWSGNVFSNDQEWAAVWNSTPFWPGIISLPDSYAKAKGLPRSQRFPWDFERGIYVINAYHNLHCILNIRESIEQFRDGRPQTIAWPHIQHCMLVLRDEILCDADDTPRYTGFQRQGSSGYGQARMCRDWSQLEAWATQPEQESCWRNVMGVLGDRPNATSREILDRYRYCSEDSAYKEMADTAWVEDAGWETATVP